MNEAISTMTPMLRLSRIMPRSPNELFILFIIYVNPNHQIMAPATIDK